MDASLIEKIALLPITRSPRAQEELRLEEWAEAVLEHVLRQWGLVSPGQASQNNRNAMQQSGQLFSVYRSQQGETFWVFTEDDHSRIVILFPEEYAEYETLFLKEEAVTLQ